LEESELKHFFEAKWTSKELIILLILTFVIVPFALEGLLQGLLSSIFHSNLYAGTFTGLIMAIVFTTAVYVVALRPFNYSWREIGILSFMKDYWKWIFVWLLILIATSIALVSIMDLFGIGTDNDKTQSLQQNMNWINITIGFVSAAIISPVYEEMFYRGFLYKWFRVKWGLVPGLFFSSIIFTLVHIPTYNTLPVNFISGLIFAWTYEKTNSIIPGMIIHGTFNGIAVILTTIA
jgi:uncharacterized protein